MRDDLRYAVRSLLNSRGFTAVAFLVIALSIAAITPIFSIVDAAWLRPLPYPRSDRLMVLYDGGIPVGGGRLPLSQRSYVEWVERQQGFEGLAAYRGGFQNATVNGNELEAWSTRVSGNFFAIFGQRQRLGRLIADDDVARERPVAVISSAFWQRAFGGRADVIGQLVTIQGTLHEVIGVATSAFSFPAGSARPYDLFIPLVVPPAQRAASPGGPPFLTAIARLRDGVSQAEAQAAIDAVAVSLAAQYPGWDAAARLQPYHEYITGRSSTWMRLLFAGVVLVFLIMCANIANLLLARGGARRREVAVRAALGASRVRIARQLVLESLLLAVAGTLAGLLAGYWILEAYRTAIPVGVPRAAEIGVDWRVALAAALAAAITGGVFGLAPAVFATRVDLSGSLKSGGAATPSRAGARFRNALVVGEVAVALVLLAGALMFVASFIKVTAIPLGVDYRNVVVTDLETRDIFAGRRVVMSEMWAENDRHHAVAERIVERVRAVPGVDDVAAASSFPFSPGRSTFSYELPGRPGFKWTRDHGMVAMKMVSPNYLQLLRIPLLRGRYLAPADSKEAEGAVVLSESAARLIFQSEDPIGQEIDLQKRLRVVGVVADVRMGGPEAEPWPDVYVPTLQGRGTMATSLVIRTALPPEQMLPSIRAAMQEVDPAQRARAAFTLESRLDALLAQRRFNMLVVGSFGALGLLIAAIGLYGVMAYLVTQRTHEIGVRMALGASRGTVLRLVLARAGLLVGAGLAAGAVGIWYFGAGVGAFLYQMSPLDPRILAGAAAVLAAAAFVAALVPARRAASVDPLIALRQD